MSADDDPVTVLSEDESWSLLTSVSLGRLVTNLRGQPEIFPVNFVTQRRTVLFRTAQRHQAVQRRDERPGSFRGRRLHHVLEGWSVIIKGRAHVLSATADIFDAQEAPLLPWLATSKPLYVRVIAIEITGRRFKFGPEPDREKSTFHLMTGPPRGSEVVTRLLRLSRSAHVQNRPHGSW